jgi:hypothetical protein
LTEADAGAERSAFVAINRPWAGRGRHRHSGDRPERTRTPEHRHHSASLSPVQ